MRQACENAKMQRFSTKKEFLYSTTLSLNLFISAVLFLRNTHPVNHAVFHPPLLGPAHSSVCFGAQRHPVVKN